MRTIKYTVSYEKLISRLPAMFAFVNIDEQGGYRLCKATEGEQGNYGKVVADLNTPKFNGGDVYECQDGTKLALSAGRHSYRTMIDIYYKAINDKEWERYKENIKKGEVIVHYKGEYIDPFLAFVERGIGLKYVGLSEKESDVEKCGVKLKEEYPLAPDYIYLGEAKTLYNKVIKMKKQLDFWEKHTKLCKEDIRFRDDLKRECVLMRVVTENGEDGDLITELTKLINEADETAKYYYDNSNGLQEEAYIPNLNFSVNLNNTIKDLGMTTPYIQEWIPGRRYYHGDVVYYVDENGYGMTWECNIKDKDLHDESKNDITFVYQDELGRKYTNGQYDEETELIYFDNGKQIPQDGKTAVNNWTPQSLNWVTENEHIDDGKTKKYVQGTQTNTVKVSGTCNSHLTSLRRYNEYINREDQVERPEPYKDWLWYYRKGTIANRESINDENGNIAVQYGKTVEDVFYAEGAEKIINKDAKIGFNIDFNGDTAQNLAIWGDVITNIECKNVDKCTGVITFTYWLGAHLTADKSYIVDEDGNKTDKWYSIDEDGNYRYYFENLKYDGDSQYGKNQGVKYTESYIYYKGDTELEDNIWTMVDKGYIEKYIRGDFDRGYIPKEEEGEDPNAPYYKTYEKMEFSTGDNMYVYDIKIGNRFKNVPYIRTNFETTVDITHVDVEKTPLIRYDYYAGVNFQPSINRDVYVERGVTQAFEKHIKFSEIKSFEDLENYSNGGFFVLSKENIDLG